MAGRASAGERSSGLPSGGWSAAQTILPGKPFHAPADLERPGTPAEPSQPAAEPQQAADIVPGFAAIEQLALVGAGASAGRPGGALDAGPFGVPPLTPPPVAVLPRSEPPSAPPPGPPSAPPPGAVAVEAGADGAGDQEEAAAGGRSRQVSPMLLVLLLVLVAVAGGGYYWFSVRGSSDSASQTISVPVQPVHHVSHTIGTPPATIDGYRQLHDASAGKLVTLFQAPMVKAGYTHVVGAAYQNPKSANSGFFVVATDGIPPRAGDVGATFTANFVAYAKTQGYTVSAPVSVPAGPLGGMMSCGSTGKGHEKLSFCLWYDHATLGVVFAPDASAHALTPAARGALEH